MIKKAKEVSKQYDLEADEKQGIKMAVSRPIKESFFASFSSITQKKEHAQFKLLLEQAI